MHDAARRNEITANDDAASEAVRGRDFPFATRRLDARREPYGHWCKVFYCVEQRRIDVHAIIRQSPMLVELFRFVAY